MKSSFELVYPPKYEDIKKESAVPNARNRTYEYVSYQEALRNLELSPSENHHLNEKKFLDKNDFETLHFEDEFAKAFEPNFSRACIKYMRFRGRKDKSFAAWLILEDGAEEPLVINEHFLKEAVMPKVSALTLVNSNLRASMPKVTAVTLLNSSEVRLLRISLKANGSRLYEVINGSCKIRCTWLVDEKEVLFTAVLFCNGRVDVQEEGFEQCRLEDLEEYKDVFVRFGNTSNPELALKDILFTDG